MAQIDVTVDPSGGAYLALAPREHAEIRTSVELDGLDEADELAALQSLVLHFDHFGRLSAIEVTGGADSVLPPALIDAATGG